MSNQIQSVDLTASSTTPLFVLGQKYIDQTGNEYKYLKANTAVSANLLYTYDEGSLVQSGLTTTVAASGKVYPLCASGIAVASGSYGWFFTGPGVFTLTTDGATAAAAKIYTTATAGKVDDVSAGTVLIPGLSAPTAIGSATTGTFVAAVGMYVSN